MSLTPANRIRLKILSGFLGSGKTTWLRHQLHEGALRGRVVIVNEAAAAAIDDALLADLARVIVIPGGCICCTRQAEFLAALRRHCDQARPPDIVLETSGLAEPARIVEAIRADPVLVHHMVIDDVLVTVDAVHARASLQSDPLVRRQLVSADRLLITKLDQLEEADVACLIATLRSINPGAQVTGTIRGEDARLPDHAGAEAFELPALAGQSEKPVVAADIAIDPAMGWEVFSLWLSALLHARGDEIFRIKGVVRTPAGRVLLQCVQKSVLPPEILPETQAGGGDFDNRVAFIGRGFDQSSLQRSITEFAADKT
ncbi:CobW family GTP-binding protein [Taklimakanibacter lacteus]|uniref:CobW family GTP-binding protein n=1 Tax=Taklimakanibacter lacteus TaxID=2268456 RepID=UPI000E660312